MNQVIESYNVFSDTSLSVCHGQLLVIYITQAITGETILLRCERIRNSMNHSLTQIQNMVPERLAAQVSETFIFNEYAPKA